MVGGRRHDAMTSRKGATPVLSMTSLQRAWRHDGNQFPAHFLFIGKKKTFQFLFYQIITFFRGGGFAVSSLFARQFSSWLFSQLVFFFDKKISLLFINLCGFFWNFLEIFSFGWKFGTSINSFSLAFSFVNIFFFWLCFHLLKNIYYRCSFSSRRLVSFVGLFFGVFSSFTCSCFVGCWRGGCWRRRRS